MKILALLVIFSSDGVTSEKLLLSDCERIQELLIKQKSYRVGNNVECYELRESED